MIEGRRFPFIEHINRQGVSNNMPYLPLTLAYQERSVEVMRLLDTGASVNVLPYEIGRQLGAVWQEQTTSVILTGNARCFTSPWLNSNRYNWWFRICFTCLCMDRIKRGASNTRTHKLFYRI